MSETLRERAVLVAIEGWTDPDGNTYSREFIESLAEINEHIRAVEREDGKLVAISRGE